MNVLVIALQVLVAYFIGMSITGFGIGLYHGVSGKTIQSNELEEWTLEIAFWPLYLPSATLSGIFNLGYYIGWKLRLRKRES